VDLKALINLQFDAYERKARIYPGLLALLPLIFAFAVVLIPQHAIQGILVTSITGCGALYALAALARSRGKAIETRLVKNWGGLPTTIMLRHRDTHIDSVTKKRLHSQIENKTGILMPTLESEVADPGLADEAYAAGAYQLRVTARQCKLPLLEKENASYGFHRNMLGLRWIGFTVAIATGIFLIVTSGLIGLAPPYLLVKALPTISFNYAMAIGISILMLCVWPLFSNERSVRRIGDAYADRLFEAISLLPAAKPRKAATL
jgi:hypothetical protein